MSRKRIYHFQACQRDQNGKPVSFIGVVEAKSLEEAQEWAFYHGCSVDVDAAREAGYPVREILPDGTSVPTDEYPRERHEAALFG